MDALSEKIDALNEPQRAAVMHGEGPLLVLAGAGSGKTRVVTLRMARLIRDGIAPGSILALTFTNKAAAEMRARCEALVGTDGSGTDLMVTTFHTFGARFLRRQASAFGRTADFTLYDDDDQVSLLKRVFESMGLGLRANEARATRDAIDRAKNAGQPLLAADLPPELLAAGGADVAREYEAALQRGNAFDFGDLILRPAELLADAPALAAALRARWKYILVDEYQDTNAAQLLLLQALAPPETAPCLVVVGDDDQAIYGWRGADVSHILSFARKWPGAEVVRLERNYRSTGHILGAANAVIGHNRDRLGKALFSADGAGERLEVRSFPTPADEARWVASRIQSLCADGTHTPADFAVLMRTNALSLDVEEALRAVRLPSVTLRGRSFYERSEVRDAVAWLRLAVNPDDDVAFRRAVAAPPRGVGESSLTKLAERARAQGISLHQAAGARPPSFRGAVAAGLSAFLDALAQAARALATGHAPERVAGTLLAPLAARLHDDARKADEGRSRAENLDRLLLSLETWRREHTGGTLGDWLEAVKLVSDSDELDTTRGAVTLLTIHAAKGLEFHGCFLIGMEEGVFPHRRGEEAPGWLEEERRLCYVAMTRAQRLLAMTHCHERRTFTEMRRNPASRFLGEVPAAHVEPSVEPSRAVATRPRFGRIAPPNTTDESMYRDETYDDLDGSAGLGGLRAGVAVWHGELGRGRVHSVNRGAAGTVTVDFPGVGRRTIVGRFLSLYEESGDSWDG